MAIQLSKLCFRPEYRSCFRLQELQKHKVLGISRLTCSFIARLVEGGSDFYLVVKFVYFSSKVDIEKSHSQLLGQNLDQHRLLHFQSQSPFSQ